MYFADTMQKVFSFILLYFFPSFFLLSSSRCYSIIYCNHIVSYTATASTANSIHDVMNQDEVIMDIEFTDREIQDLLDFIESLSESSEEEVQE